MKKITLIIASTLLLGSVYAQENKEASKLLGYERYSSVKEKLKNATSEEDKYNLGLAEIGLGNLTAAEQIFSGLGESDYGKAGLARLAFLKGDVNKGNSLLDEIVAKVKKKDIYKYKIAADAVTYTKGGNIDKAIEWYKLYLDREKNAIAHISLGDAYLLKNQAVANGEALKNFEAAVRLEPNNSLSFSRQGLLFYQAGMYEDALNQYSKASSADVNNPLPYRDLARAYYQLGKYELAKTNIEKYLSLSDASEEDLYHYTNTLYLTKDYPGVIKKVDEMLGTISDPKPYLYRIKAFSLFETGDIVNAKNASNLFFQKEKDASKILAEDYVYQGKISLKEASTSDSITKESLIKSADNSFEKALSMKDTSRSDRELITNIATEFENIKDYGLTAKWYGKLVEKMGSEVRSTDLFNYGYWLYYSLDFNKSFETFETMSQKFPSDEDLYYSEFWKGMVSTQLDKNAETGKGVPYFTKWLELTVPEGKSRSNSQLKNAYQYLTFFHYNKNDKTNAVKYANLLKEVDANNEMADQILKHFSK